MCQSGKITGISADGGWAEYLLTPAEALASIPDELSADEAAPLLCAGITTFNSLRRSGARAGDLVAIHGIGGLGHLGIQFAAKLGFSTVAIGRGKDKEHLGENWALSQYIDSSSANTSEQLKAMGGARVILATAPDSKAISSLVDGLGVDGKLLIVAAPGEPITVNPITLIGKRASVQGWPSGIATDSEDTLRFSALTGIRPMIERFPLLESS